MIDTGVMVASARANPNPNRATVNRLPITGLLRSSVLKSWGDTDLRCPDKLSIHSSIRSSISLKA
jgi:hypothetical protein